MASLGWIHFSPTFRDRVNTILDMMDEEGMIDELGMGSFRDAFADIFFPGLSTIQTRAKYFFIIPYIIKDYINLPAHKQNGLDKFLFETEHEIMWKLAAKYNFDRNSGSGVIGITKKPKNRLARRPSSIYWNGLRTLGFIKTNLSLSEYCLRLKETESERMIRSISDNSEDCDDADVEFSERHCIKVSTYKSNWKEGLDMPLDYEEADFLKQKIIQNAQSSLLNQIISKSKLSKPFMRCKNFRGFANSVLHEDMTDDLKQNLILAHDLDVVNEGLHLIYCNEINKKYYNYEDYYEKWSVWEDDIYNQIVDLNNLHGERLVSIAPRANFKTKTFIIKVLEMVRSKNMDYSTLAALVIQQEKDIKQHKSRFKPNAEIDFRKGERKSLSNLNYRYTNAKTIVSDIFNGISQSYA